jgi:chorismate mutase
MPDTAPPAEIAEPAKADLAALRGELDRLDDAIHDLLMRRAQVVARIGADGAKGRVKLRPGREAAILRRLLRRHDGPLGRQALVRIWRELFAASAALQAPLLIAVGDPDPAAGLAACAREHFGALTPIRMLPDPAHAIAEVGAGRATAAVLPMPSERGPSAPGAGWWTTLSPTDVPRIHVVARLPFWSPRPEGAPVTQALVIAAIKPDPTGDDRSLLRIEISGDINAATLRTALSAAGLSPAEVVLRRQQDGAAAEALIDVAGYIGESDPRLARLDVAARAPVVLGAYAAPVDGGPA